MEISFIVDSNAGRLARWLRLMGYDALFFTDMDDSRLLRIAMEQGRVVLTKDTQMMRRRVISNGQLKALLIESDDYREQLSQVVRELRLDCRLRPFTRCLECNQTLVPRSKDDVKGLVPPYVFGTQRQYMQCPACLRLYWRGTHWQRMKEELEKLPADHGASG